MATETFVKRSRIEAAAAETFRWHERPGALARLLPPFERTEVVETPRDLRDGARAVLRVPVGPFHRTWVAEHRGYEEGRRFQDVQVQGPFATWVHTHVVEPDGDAASVLEDRVEWALPMGGLGRLLAGRSVRRTLERVFAWRHRTTADDLAAHGRHAGRPPLKVLVSGATGLLGRTLIPFLTTGGHEVVRLVRRGGPARPGDVPWDVPSKSLDPRAIEGVDAVVHLAGEPVAGRWSEAKKRRIRDSRVLGTQVLVGALTRLERPPSVLVSASAVGIYGDRGDETLTESSSAGHGFLADVGREWEIATREAEERGIRVVRLRLGVVLTPAGGALAKLLPPFRWGLGGRIGSGRQWMSWVGIDDVVGAVLHAIRHEGLAGPVNLVAPEPATNRDLARTLGRVLRRPTLLPVPAFAARLGFGEMAREMLLAGQRVEPRRLLETGYAFRHPSLEGALRHVLGRPAGA